MKRILFVFGVMFLPALMFAQSKIGWINSQAVMDKLPEAQDAQHQLDNTVADWQNELHKMQNDWQKKYDEYDKKKLILTDAQRADAEKELQAEWRTFPEAGRVDETGAE